MMLSSRTSRWTAATAVLCVLLIVAAWFLLVGPRRADAADLDQQRSAADFGNQTLEQKIAELQVQFAELPKRRAELAAIRKQLPAAPDVPNLVRNLNALAIKSGIKLVSITPGVGKTLTSATPTSPAVISTSIALNFEGDYIEDGLFVKALQTELSRVFLITSIKATLESAEAATVTDPNATDPTPTPTAMPTPTPTSTSTSNDFTVALKGEVYSLTDLDQLHGATPSASPSPVPSAAPTVTATP